jgi:hypothetical protein
VASNHFQSTGFAFLSLGGSSEGEWYKFIAFATSLYCYLYVEDEFLPPLHCLFGKFAGSAIYPLIHHCGV